MFDDTQSIKVFRVTLKKVIERLSTIKDCDVAEFVETVKEQFDGYEYDECDTLVGYENWQDISQDGEYKLNIKIDHKDAYEFTLYVTVNDKKATITNVL